MYMPSIFGENLFDDFFEDFARPVRHRHPAPMRMPAAMKTDVKETEEGYQLDIDLPGFKKDDVQAQLKDGYLTIKAETSSENEQKDDARYIRRERTFGSCSRSFYVGNAVTEEDIKAKFEDGILKVMIPKKEAKAVEENHMISIEG